MAANLIEPIQLPLPGTEELRAEAQSEGYNFIETLIQEWASGENRFSSPGEILCGHLDRGLLVAVGGLNRDPFIDNPKVGRIRRVYVRRTWRNRGIGEALVRRLVDEAREEFSTVRLRAENPQAARLYERIGFVPDVEANATHVLHFK